MSRPLSWSASDRPGRGGRACRDSRRRLSDQRALHDREGGVRGTSARPSAAWTSSPGSTWRSCGWPRSARSRSTVTSARRATTSHALRGADRARAAAVRDDPHAATARRAAGHPTSGRPASSPTAGRSGWGSRRPRGCVLANRLQGRTGRRVRPDGRRRAARGPVLGVARRRRTTASKRSPWSWTTTRSIRHAGRAGEQPGRPGGEAAGVRWAVHAATATT